jgi:hypothetical protein
MNGIEERLREDLRSFAQRAQPGAIRPLRVPDPPGRAGRVRWLVPRGRTGAARWLAPVAAAAAVVAVLAGLTLAGRAVGNRPSAPSAAAGMPRYYVTVVSTRSVSSKQTYEWLFHHKVPVPPKETETAIVHDSVTGRVVGWKRLPPVYNQDQGGITAAANDQSFAITTGSGIFMLGLAADGRPTQLRLLPISPDNYVTGDAAALSPDGSHLAVAVESNSGSFGIEVFSLATGAQKTWWGPVSGNLSWSGDGKQVMFLEASQTGGYLLLNTTGPAGRLLADSRRLPIPTPPFEGMAMLTPDGSGVITSTWQTAPGHVVISKIVELSSGSGRLLRVLRTASAHYSGNLYASGLSCGVLALGPVGVQPLVQCFALGRIEGSRFTQLPGGPPPAHPGRGGNNLLVTSWDAAW